MRHTRTLKAYVCDLSAQMNATPKMDGFAKKFIFLVGLQKWAVDQFSKFSKRPKDMVGIISIAERIKANGPNRKSNSLAQQSGLCQNLSKNKIAKKLRTSNQHKGQADKIIPKKSGNQRGITQYQNTRRRHERQTVPQMWQIWLFSSGVTRQQSECQGNLCLCR